MRPGTSFAEPPALGITRWIGGSNPRPRPNVEYEAAGPRHVRPARVVAMIGQRFLLRLSVVTHRPSGSSVACQRFPGPGPRLASVARARSRTMTLGRTPPLM